MSLFSKIGGALKGAAKVVTTPERLAARGVKSVLGGGGPSAGAPTAVPGVGMMSGMPGGLGNAFHGSATAAPPMMPNVPPPNDIATNGGGQGFGGLLGALAAQHGGLQSIGGGPIQPPAPGGAPGGAGGLWGAIQQAGGNVGAPQFQMPATRGGVDGILSASHPGSAAIGMGGQPMAAGQAPGGLGGRLGSIAALLKAQQQGQGAGAGASNLLQSQYPGLE